jgi:YheC/D like ATP-grasp
MSGADKMRKNSFMKKEPLLRGHIPITSLATTQRINNMLDQHKDIIIKPNNGSGGRSVYRVTDLGSNHYRIHHESSRANVHTRKEVFRRLRIQQKSGLYLVQPRIKLAQIKGRPFDLRVIVQRKRNSNEWQVTAKAAKIAGRGYIVTNVTRSGGYLQHVSTALRNSSLPDSAKRSLPTAIDQLAIAAATRLNKLYRHQRIFGIDMGVDRSGQLWIIEANRRPSMSHFIKLGDSVMYRRIQSFKR